MTAADIKPESDLKTLLKLYIWLDFILFKTFLLFFFSDNFFNILNIKDPDFQEMINTSSLKCIILILIYSGEQTSYIILKIHK